MSIEKVKFFVDHNKNAEGAHMVHRISCENLPASRDREYMGKYTDAKVAINHAEKSDFDPAVACPICCPECF